MHFNQVKLNIQKFLLHFSFTIYTMIFSQFLPSDHMHFSSNSFAHFSPLLNCTLCCSKKKAARIHWKIDNSLTNHLCASKAEFCGGGGNENHLFVVRQSDSHFYDKLSYICINLEYTSCSMSHQRLIKTFYLQYVSHAN